MASSVAWLVNIVSCVKLEDSVQWPCGSHCHKVENHKFLSAGKVSTAFYMVERENDMAAFF